MKCSKSWFNKVSLLGKLHSIASHSGKHTNWKLQSCIITQTKSFKSNGLKVLTHTHTHTDTHTHTTHAHILRTSTSNQMCDTLRCWWNLGTWTVVVIAVLIAGLFDRLQTQAAFWQGAKSRPPKWGGVPQEKMVFRVAQWPMDWTYESDLTAAGTI